MTTFTLREARSPGITAAIAAVVVIETAGLHLLLVARHPVVAWALTLSSLSLLAWLVRDYRKLAMAEIAVDDSTVTFMIGARFEARVPRESISGARAPSWRDPAPPREYLNATKPAQPNVVLSFEPAARIRLFGMVERPVTELGLCVDDAPGLVALLARGPSGAA